MALLEWLASKPEINLFSSFIYTALKHYFIEAHNQIFFFAGSTPLIRFNKLSEKTGEH